MVIKEINVFVLIKKHARTIVYKFKIILLNFLLDKIIIYLLRLF